MDDADKLSQPAYRAAGQRHRARRLRHHAYASGTAITRIVRYDLTIIDTKLLRVVHALLHVPGALLHATSCAAPASRGRALSAYAARLRRKPYADTVTVAPETFAVALRDPTTPLYHVGGRGLHQPGGRERLPGAAPSPANPSLAGTLHVLPQFEVAA